MQLSGSFEMAKSRSREIVRYFAAIFVGKRDFFAVLVFDAREREKASAERLGPDLRKHSLEKK